MRTAVSRLRRVVGDTLVTAPPGYELQTDPDYERLHPRKSESESINRGIDDALPLGCARSYTAKGQLLDLLGYCRAINSLTRYLYGTTSKTALIRAA